MSTWRPSPNSLVALPPAPEHAPGETPRFGSLHGFPRSPVIRSRSYTFVLDAQGKVSEMKLDVPNPDFDFKELEFKRLAERK